jgi:hypothetical protein
MHQTYFAFVFMRDRRHCCLPRHAFKSYLTRGEVNKRRRSRGAALCARAILHGTKRRLQTSKGRRSAERRGGRYRGRAQAERRLCLRLIAARAPFGKRARLPALYRGSCQGLSTLAQSGPALHGSGDVRYPGSQLLADLRRGRPGEFPNRPRTELRAPSRAPLSPASIGRHRLTSLGRARWVLLVRRGVMIQEIPRDAAISLNLMQNFFGCLFDSHRRKCGTLP